MSRFPSSPERADESRPLSTFGTLALFAAGVLICIALAALLGLSESQP